MLLYGASWQAEQTNYSTTHWLLDLAVRLAPAPTVSQSVSDSFTPTGQTLLFEDSFGVNLNV